MTTWQRGNYVYQWLTAQVGSDYPAEEAYGMSLSLHFQYAPHLCAFIVLSFCTNVPEPTR